MEEIQDFVDGRLHVPKGTVASSEGLGRGG